MCLGFSSDPRQTQDQNAGKSTPYTKPIPSHLPIHREHGYGYSYGPGYNYAPGYGYVPSAYVGYPGNYAYRYAPPYTPDYNGYFGTYQRNGGGNG